MKVLAEGSKYDFIVSNMIFAYPIAHKFLAKVKHEKLNNFFHEPMSMLYFCENVASIDTKKLLKGFLITDHMHEIYRFKCF